MGFNHKTGKFYQNQEDSGMNFSDALHDLKRGLKLQRRGWNGKDMWIKIRKPDHHSRMSLPYIYMRTAQGHTVPWLASQTDILADDWTIHPDMVKGFV